MLGWIGGWGGVLGVLWRAAGGGDEDGWMDVVGLEMRCDEMRLDEWMDRYVCGWQFG